MTDLAAIRAEQLRCGEWLRDHQHWRDSADVAERNAYQMALLGARDWIVEEMLLLREAAHD